MSNLIEKAVERLERQHERAGGSPPAPAPAPERGAPVEDWDGPAVPGAEREPIRARGGTQEGEPAPRTRPGRGRTSRSCEIDLARLATAGMVTPQSGATAIAEQHRLIKRPLLRKAFATNGERVGNENLILVTSALPAEGKTFISINLAMSIAMEVDRTVLLIDADPMRRGVTQVLDIPSEPGLTDYLKSTDLPLSDVLLRTNVPNLSVLPSGSADPHVTELFSSDYMQRLAVELSHRYADRVVIFDSPPVLATSGAGALSHLVGQIVFVVEAVRTPQSAIREALDALEPHPNIGLVLNKSRKMPGAGARYGYGYGYGYGDRHAGKA